MDEADRLKAEWEKRGQSRLRDLYIASHPGWDDPGAWQRQAEKDVEHILTNIGAEALREMDVCELGCGVGRLIPALAPRVASYTGIDIAPAMLEEARRRCGDLSNVRFLESDGTGLPEDGRDREYGLLFAAAVFIHCPRDVIEANLRSMKTAAAPGGEVRFHLRAEVTDPEGMVGPETVVKVSDAQQVDKEVDLNAIVRDAGEEALIGDGYMGHAFRYAEAGEMTRDVFGEDSAIMRLSRGFIVGGWTRPD